MPGVFADTLGLHNTYSQMNVQGWGRLVDALDMARMAGDLVLMEITLPTGVSDII